MSDAEIGLAITVALNVGALIWGAATMSSSVKTLNATVADLKVLFQGITGVVAEHSIELHVLDQKITHVEQSIGETRAAVDSLREHVTSGFTDLRGRMVTAMPKPRR